VIRTYKRSILKFKNKHLIGCGIMIKVRIRKELLLNVLKKRNSKFILSILKNRI